jgi:NAD(P)-dependent dehydrogenase (short-subunit alcohol dehydrogenase family)
MAGWTIKDIASQSGRVTVITGATGGLGFETALVLAAAGAEVVLTGRNAAKGSAALQRIHALHPTASIRYEHLDLASLASVAAFAELATREYGSLDLLVNNAGVMTPPTRQTTADGFELQFGTNYLSHFALTGRLLPLLQQGRQPRVVNLSSIAHRLEGAIHFDDLQWQRRYKPWAAYAQSKLAMLMFALELQRRSDAGGWGIMSNASHPGYARTDLIIQPLMSQSAADGALPTLFAATASDAKGGRYYGPKGVFELTGPSAEAVIGRRALDKVVAARLWEVSEHLTGVQWPEGMPATAA